MYYWKTILYWQFIRFCPASSYKTRSSVRYQVFRSWGLADILSQWTRRLVLTFCELILWLQLGLPYALQVQLSVFSFKKATLKQRGESPISDQRYPSVPENHLPGCCQKGPRTPWLLRLLWISPSSQSAKTRPKCCLPQPSWCSLPSQKWLLTFPWNHGAL